MQGWIIRVSKRPVTDCFGGLSGIVFPLAVTADIHGSAATVYAKTREEAEPLLEQMTREVRARIDAEKAALKAGQAEQPEAGTAKG